MGVAAGTRLGPYEILAPVGAGGMGEVYKARDTRLDRLVAIKLLAERAAGHEVPHLRFRQEARTISQLNHPHICALYDLGEQDGTDFLVMEYVEGETLARRLQAGALPIQEALRIAAEITAALAAAHRAGIVHRDLKPSNIMLHPESGVKVLDFGLSKVLRAEASPDAETVAPDPETSTLVASQTGRGAVLGTAGYMSPEQACGRPVDQRSDIFAFGVVLYEMLTGRRAFPGPSSLGAMRAVLNAEVPPLEKLRSGVPAAIHRLVARCLQKDPAQRFASGAELSAELQRVFATPAFSLRAWRRRHPALAATVVIAVVAAATAGGILLYRHQAERSFQAGLREIEQNVDRGRYASAFRIARRLQQKRPGDPRLQRAFMDLTLPMNVRTDPPGAEIYYRDFLDESSPWEHFGTAPMENTRVPFGGIHWRIEKAGYEPVEGRFPWWGDKPVTLPPKGSVPPGMVAVPKGAPGVPRLPDVALGPFWLGKYEVTNLEFRAFVRAGGYQEPRFWKFPFEKDGRVLSWKDAMAVFVDKTGRPGPATWELGDYPAGQDNYPVGGISWYEAEAYAEFAGAALPTIFHWVRATGMSNMRDDIERGIFASAAPQPVTELKDLGAFGTLGMSGNIKEWCFNAVEGQRYILGGGFDEPMYMAANFDARPPFDRSPTNGLRLARYPEPPPTAALDMVPPRAAIQPVAVTPVSDEVFNAFRGFYTYDHSPFTARLERMEESEYWRKETVTLPAAYGHDTLIVHLLIPKNARPPYQAVIYYPGSYAYTLPSSDPLPVPIYFDFIPRSGRVLVHPVYQGTYERRSAGGAGLRGPRWRDMMLDTSKDLGRTVDYLETRSDIDRSRLAFYVLSTGATVVPAITMEPRIKTAVFLSAGLGPRQPNAPPEIAAMNFAPRLRIPVLQLGGRYDFVLPLETAQKPLFNLFGTPASDKKLVIFEAGHIPPRNLMIRETLNWLDHYLGPVALK